MSNWELSEKIQDLKFKQFQYAEEVNSEPVKLKRQLKNRHVAMIR